MKEDRQDSASIHEPQREMGETLGRCPVSLDELPVEEARRLIRDLFARQIELEMENESLRRTRAELAEDNVRLEQEIADRLGGIRLISERKNHQAGREWLLAQSIQDREAVEELARMLERERAVLGAVIEHTHNQFAYLDPQFNFVWVNAAYARGSGYSAQALVGRNHFALFPDAENQSIFEGVRDTGQTAAFHAKPFVFPDRPELGTTYWDWTLAPVKGTDGKADGLVLSLLDVTARERARVEREAQWARQSLLAEVSGQILEQNSIQGVLQHTVDAACKLTGARLAVSGSISPDGHFEIGPTHRAEGAPPCLPGQVFTIERGGIYLDLIQDRPSLRLTDEEMRRHPAWWGLPEGHVPLDGFLGARLGGQDGRAMGVIMLSDKAGEDFTTEDEALLVQLASLASLGLQHIAAREEAERRADELDAVFDAMLDAVIVYDADGVVTRANRIASTAADIDPMGLGRAELVRAFETRTLDEQPVAVDDLPSTRALRGEVVTGEQFLIRSAQGNDLTTLVSATPLWRQGAVSGVVLLWHDITELKEAQRTLERYAGRLQLLREADRAILASQSAEEIGTAVLPYLWQLVPYTWASVTTFDRQADQVSQLAAMFADGTESRRGWQGSVDEVWFLGELHAGEIYVEEHLERLASSPLFEDLWDRDQKALVSVPLVFQDQVIGSLNLGMADPGLVTPEQVDVLFEIADQLTIGIRQAELHARVRHHVDELEQIVAQRTAALRVSQERLQAVYDAAPLGIVLVDGEGRILESNPAFGEIVGYSAEELAGKGLDELTHSDRVHPDLDLFEALMADQRDHYQLEKRYVRKDGRSVWVALSVTAIRVGEGCPRLALKMVEDITEKRQARRALIQSEKLAATGRLAASLAHEINNPLQAVIGCLDLVEGELAEGGDPARYLAVAQRELDRAARVVSQLRGIHSRSTIGERELADVNALVRQMLLVAAGHCKRHKVEVDWCGTDSLPPVSVVPDQLKQVFLNLVLNAVDAMPDGGQLKVSTARTGTPDGIEVRLADTGFGISAEDLPRLFEPFYTTRSDGLGLGLYVSRSIVEQHGGRIEIESTVGEGTICTVWLPR